MKVVTIGSGKFGEVGKTTIYPAGARNFGKATQQKLAAYAKSAGEQVLVMNAQFVTITGTHIFDNI